MEAEHPFDFFRAVRDLSERGIRFVLIGRQAMKVYGAPVQTQDYDLWVDPARRRDVIEYFETDLELETSDGPDGRKPIVFAVGGLDKVDLIFVRAISNLEGEQLMLDDVFERAIVVTDEETGQQFRVPAIEDLIASKKCRAGHRRDEEDVRYLLVRKELERRGDLEPLG